MIRSFGRHKPQIHSKAFVHDSAEVIGRVSLAAGASVWPMAVLRGDVHRIAVGERTNIQDHCTVHCDHDYPTVIGRGVTVGHGAVLHGCRVLDGCLVGMGATVLECVIGPECLIGAGALLPRGTRIPRGSLVLGIPGKVVRPLTPRELAALRGSAADYVRLAREFLETSRVVFP
ncbi:MAG TPA: gamma carbonic anhydrase family protein [Elusimicrobia bacterium]|nr:gamma carbonic anhydrase family protein [Elusimicrobiota bacterium]HBT62753.1 gamma carbonic anhydrase family protein [Elusimicrobiota bacterium]